MAFTSADFAHASAEFLRHPDLYVEFELRVFPCPRVHLIHWNPQTRYLFLLSWLAVFACHLPSSNPRVEPLDLQIAPEQSSFSIWRHG